MKCYCGTSARVGFSNGTGAPGTAFELAGSGINGAFLNTNVATGLIHNNFNSGVLGRYVFSVRNGVPETTPDSDGDSFADDLDNCPHAPNPDQDDDNFNGLGNACETPGLLHGTAGFLQAVGNGNTIAEPVSPLVSEEPTLGERIFRIVEFRIENGINDDAAALIEDLVGGLVEHGIVPSGDAGALIGSVLALLNAPPVIDPIADQVVNEGSTLTVPVVASDPDAGDTLTYSLDAAPAGAAIDPVTGVFTWTPVEGPATAVITVRVTDSASPPLSATRSFNVTVNNVAPALNSLTNSAAAGGLVGEGQAVTLSAFTDPGAIDTHVASINWGDGAVTPGVVNQVGRRVSGTHAYAFGGVYTVTVTLTDDDGGTDVRTTTAIISGIGTHNGLLQIIGTRADDHANVNLAGGAADRVFKIHADFLPPLGSGVDAQGRFRNIPAAGVTGLLILLFGGDDFAAISGGISTPALIDGGDGSDHLNGGGGRDVLIGGRGSDRLVAGGGDDTLVAPLAFGGDAAGLRSVAAGLLALTAADITNDGDRDLLTGGTGTDTFYLNVTPELEDIVTDATDVLRDV